MSKIKEIALSLMAWISGGSAFILLGSMVLMLSLVIDPRHFDRFIKLCCRTIVRALFIRIRVRGRHRLDPKRTYLFIANHVNLFDVFVLYGYIPHFCRAVELDEHFNWLFYGPIIRRLGMIPISHTRGRQAVNALNKARQALQQGTSILILPEGHRTLDGRLRPFQRGAFHLALNAGVDIAPIAMVGAFAINRKGSLLIKPGKLTLQFGQPIRFSDCKNMDSDQLRALAHRQLSALLTDE